MSLNSWTKLIEDQHAWAHRNDGYRLILQAGAAETELDSLNEQMGIQYSHEFRDFYRCHNGVGVCHTSDPDKIYWVFVPTSSIPDITLSARDWFKETHPTLAARFFPFMDWNSGDYSGYILAQDGALAPGIFTFEHEAYLFDEDQPPEDFMITVYSSIAEALISR